MNNKSWKSMARFRCCSLYARLPEKTVAKWSINLRQKSFRKVRKVRKCCGGGKSSRIWWNNPVSGRRPRVLQTGSHQHSRSVYQASFHKHNIASDKLQISSNIKKHSRHSTHGGTEKRFPSHKPLAVKLEYLFRGTVEKTPCQYAAETSMFQLLSTLFPASLCSNQQRAEGHEFVNRS